ncbi:hypothetical protein ANO11243_018560 [Dothideomycetidae sp. 11243]|nr:hypothetical protein ANO11243_018560 [fungal sp. No.11243]
MADSTPNARIGRLAIVGGGISGVSLALALIQRGIHVQIYEQSRHFAEIGAGLAFNDAAVRAMKICSPDINTAFEKVRTNNQWPDKSGIMFDCLDGEHDTEVAKQKRLFVLSSGTGTNAVHRAHFLEAIAHYLPDGIVHFGKHLDTIVEQKDSSYQLKFHDGSTADADSIIACDGIKSSVRIWMFGDTHPCSHPQYTYKYAYRGLVPVARAREALGDDIASNSHFHLGRDGHVLTFPVDHGATMNVVLFHTATAPWDALPRLTQPSTKEQVKRDFSHHGATVRKVIDLLEPQLDCWAIFDTGDSPLPHYNRGRVCLLGDAAHATTPHHGAGAGMCIEDCAVMAELLADERVTGPEGVQAAFQAFNDQRLERTQWLVQSSRRVGELWDMKAEGVGDDVEMIKKEIIERYDMVWNGQVKEYIAEAKELLGKILGEAK